MYSSFSFLTSALDGGEWSASRRGRALAPGKVPPVPIVQEAGWAQEPVWTQRLKEKSLAFAGDRSPGRPVNSQTILSYHGSSCPVGTRGKERQGRDADQSLPTNAEVKNE
jgi:hypothetical protein